MSVFGIIAVYKQEKWISDPLSLDIKEDKDLRNRKQQQEGEQEDSVNAILKNCKQNYMEILEIDFQHPAVLMKNNISSNIVTKS